MEFIKNKSITLIFTAIVTLSVVINQPFLSISFFPRVPRLLIEAVILLIFICFLVRNKERALLFTVAAFGSLLATGYMYSGTDLKLYIGIFNKVTFAIGFFGFLKNYKKYTELFTKAWVTIWILIAIWVVFGGITYIYDPSQFKYYNFKNIDPNAPYLYLISKYGQIFIYPHYLEFIGRSCGLFFEPIHLGFISWLNILTSKSIYKEGLIRNTMIISSIATGILSRSGAFFIVSLIVGTIYIASKLFKLKDVRKLIYASILGIFATVATVDLSSIGSFTSRAEKYKVGLKVILDSSFLNFLFGHGFEKTLLYSDRAFSSTFNSLGIYFGIVFLSFWVILVAKLSRKKSLAFYSLALYFLMINPSFYMIFYFLIIISYWSDHREESSPSLVTY